MNCTECGESVSYDAKFCPNCGTNLVKSTKPENRNTCFWCGGTNFSKEEGRLDSKWGMTSHKFILMICNNCGYVHQFYEGRSIFDFD